ncbi:MAG: FtsX-like permease family protein [Candidatus Sulfotelmatobacter sp.]|jgi:putative ABC transport system permease protein
MISKMVVANLVQRPIRSLISISAVALEVILILLIVAFFYGQLNGSKASQMGVGADVMVQPPGSSALVGVTGAPMPVKVGDKLRQLPHVLVAAPVIWELTTKPSLEIIYGIDIDSYNSISPPFRFLSGGPFQEPYDVIVDDYFAGAKRVKVGDSVEILNNQFRICGIVEHGKGARKFLPLSTLQDLIGAPGHASVFYVKLDDPRNVDAVVDEIKQVPGMENYSVRSMQEYLSMMTPENLPGFATSIRIVIAISMIIGFLVIFQSMYTAVMERTREIGILKSLGASKLYIVNVVLRETALLAIVGVVVGTIMSLLARRLILFENPTLRLFWSAEWVVRATVIALTGAVLGALYPAYKAAQKDPIDALAYE